MLVPQKILNLYLYRLIKEVRVVLPIIFIFLLAINLSAKISFDQAKDDVLANSQNIPAHLFLARQLLANNQLAEAETEFKLASSLPDINKIGEIKLQPEKIKEEIVFWQKVVEEFPNYRDAYLKLAILNYKINRLFDAQKFLDKALSIDPNSEVANKFLKFLK